MRDCACLGLGLKPDMSLDELKTFNRKHPGGCTSYFICPTLDAEFVRARKEDDRRSQYKKRLKKQGFTDEQLESRAPRSRARVGSYSALDLFPTRRRVSA